RARAVRHVDRHVALGAHAPRARHRGRKSAERRRKRLRVVRRHGAPRRADDSVAPPQSVRAEPRPHRDRGSAVKLLLTSAGIKNASIEKALVDMLGKPIAESDALCIPTGLYAHPWAGPRQAWRCISGQETGTPTVGLGWKSMGVLELTALPSLDADRWVPHVQAVDALLGEGGDAAYLCHWMRASGLADLLPSLHETVWVGVSAGSMVMTPCIGTDFVTWHSPAGDTTLGVVDFSIF